MNRIVGISFAGYEERAFKLFEDIEKRKEEVREKSRKEPGSMRKGVDLNGEHRRLGFAINYEKVKSVEDGGQGASVSS